jgi:1,4-dihydroxy-2-naphthoyl-CoA hydrolase
MDLVTTLQEQIAQLFPHVLELQLQEVSPERVVAHFTVRRELCTLGEIAHGGALMTFADTLGAIATLVNLPPGSRTTTIESKTNFLGAARLGSQVSGECVPLHHGKQTMVWQTTLQSAGRPCAVVIQTQLILG